MYPTRFMQLLADGGIAPDNIRPLAELFNDWFAAEPNVLTFTLRSIFNDLFPDWDDQQGIPTAQYAVYEQRLLPELKAIAPLSGSGHSVHLQESLERLVKAYHGCRASDRRRGI
jgi:hypothetical protein